MAINFLNTVNLNKNQLTQAAIESQPNDAAVGGAPVEGQIYFNTTDFDLKIFANGAWKEVGATSGVETLSTTQAGNSTGNTLTVLTNAVGDVTINSFAYAGGSNIGYVPSGGAVNQYLDGTGAWVDVTTGDIESVNASTVNNRLGIAITTPLGPDPVVGLDVVGLTNLGATAASDDELIIYDTSTTTNKSITVENLVGGYETTYDLTTAPTGTAVRLTSSDATDPAEDVTISGTTGRTAITRISTTELRVDLTDDVNIIDDLFVGGVITQTGIGSTTALNSGALNNSTALVLTAANAAIKLGMQVTGTGVPSNITIAAVTNSFTFTLSSAITIANVTTLTFEEVNSFAAPLDMNNNRLHEVKTGVLGTDGVNLGQVELLVAGVGVFKGGYNATTDPGVPVISGASNIALDQGDYFIVTHDGDITFSDQAISVEVGDFIFANASITADDDPASTEYTFVIADANVAGAGATDGATEKGVSGFDSANFDVSASGWVQLNSQRNPYGAKVVLDNGASATPATSPVSRATTGTPVDQTTFTVNIDDASIFGSGALAANVKVEVLNNASPLETVYPLVERSGSGSLAIKFSGDVAINLYQVLLSHI